MPKERKAGKAKKKAKKAEEVRTAADIAAERAASVEQEAAAAEATPTAEEEAKPSARETEAGPEAEAPPEEEPTGEAVPEVTVAALLKGTVELLAVQAWQHMGLQVSPQTGELHKDLPQAQLAIDAAAAIVEKLQADLSEEERKQFEGLLANLRLNYVQRGND
ncbi:MAG: DUF1844 domain-containing protein [Armatimonadota bacterium]